MAYDRDRHLETLPLLCGVDPDRAPVALSQAIANGATGNHVRIDAADVILAQETVPHPFSLADQEAIGEPCDDRGDFEISFLVGRGHAGDGDRNEALAAGDRVERPIKPGLKSLHHEAQFALVGIDNRLEGEVGIEGCLHQVRGIGQQAAGNR